MMKAADKSALPEGSVITLLEKNRFSNSVSFCNIYMSNDVKSFEAFFIYLFN